MATICRQNDGLAHAAPELTLRPPRGLDGRSTRPHGLSATALGKGINQAIPVTNLQQFLQTPDIGFSPPELTAANLYKPVEFKAQAGTFAPGSPEPELKLIITAGDGETREFSMKKQGNNWTVTASPGGKADTRIEVSVRLASGTVTGLATAPP